MDNPPTTERRRITRAEFDALRADVAECLRLLRQLAQVPAAPTQAVHDPDRGMFIPGTGWIADERTPKENR